MRHRAFFMFLFIVIGRSVLGQTQSSPVQDDLINYYPKKFITHIDLLLGPSIIFPGGNEFLKDKRVIKVGYLGGLALSCNLSTTLELCLNLLYENKGIKAEYEYLNTDFTPPIIEQSVQNLDLNYLTVTFLPRYTSKSGIFISLGPYLGYLLSERIRITTYQNGVIINQSGSRPDPYLNYKKFDFGLSGVVGYRIKINKRNIGYIQITYNHGLISANQPIILDVKNNTYSLLLAYHLRSTKN